MGCHRTEIWPGGVVELEVVKGNKRAPSVGGTNFARANANPVDFARDAMCLRLVADAADANNRVVVVVPNGTHAVVDPEDAHSVRVATMSSFVDEDSHDDFQKVRATATPPKESLFAHTRKYDVTREKERGNNKTNLTIAEFTGKRFQTIIKLFEVEFQEAHTVVFENIKINPISHSIVYE